MLYGLFGAILAVGKLGFGRDLLAYLMKGITLPAAGLDAPHLGVGGVLRVHGRRQLVRRVPLLRPDLGHFKVWGGIGLFLVFALAQGVWLARHVDRGDARDGAGRERADVPAALRARLAPLAPAVLEITRRQRRARRPRRRRRRRRALFAADRVEGLLRIAAPRSGTSGSCAKSPTSCRTRSTRCRSRR